MAEARLLIVEPDAAIGELFAVALQEEGYAVERTSSHADALALLAARGSGSFDLVLSSPNANPRTQPYYWLDQLRAATSARIVICSSYPPAVFQDHRARGFAAYLQEPFDLQDLINLVAALVDGAGE